MMKGRTAGHGDAKGFGRCPARGSPPSRATPSDSTNPTTRPRPGATQAVSAPVRRFVSKGQLSQLLGAESVNRLNCTPNLKDLENADAIIKAIVEPKDIKKKY